MTVSGRFRSGVVLFSLAACLAVATPAWAENPVTVMLRVGLQKVSGLGTMGVPLGYEFRGGDRFRIDVKPDHDGYLYLLRQDEQGRFERLWPQGDQVAPVRAGEAVQVPANGNLRLDTAPGAEKIQILFSLKPVADPLAVLVPDGGKDSGKKARKIRQIRLRAVELDETAPPGTSSAGDFTGLLDEAGVAVLEISVRHK